MAANMRVRKAIEVEHYPVASADIIEIGDMVFYNGTSNAVEKLSDFTWTTNLATTQAALKGSFAGVAMARSNAGDTAAIRVATKGEATFTCASAAFNPDEFVGADDNATPDGLLDGQIIGVASAALAIGKPSKVQAASTICFVNFQSDITGNPVA